MLVSRAGVGGIPSFLTPVRLGALRAVSAPPKPTAEQPDGWLSFSFPRVCADTALALHVSVYYFSRLGLFIFL